MADEMEKTEEPTSKKISDARKDGNVPKSQETSGLITLAIAIGMLLFYMKYIFSSMKEFYIFYISFIGRPLTSELLFELLFRSLLEAVIVIIPFAGAIMLAGVIGNVAQFGFLFTLKPIKPKLEKINPIKGLKQLFSMKKVVEGFKMTFKVAVAFGVGFYLFMQFLEEIPKLELFDLNYQIEWLIEKAMIIAFAMLAVFLAFAIFDFAYQRYTYKKNLKMSKQEVKDEMKNMEGNPEIKAKIRQLQMQATQKRMMSAIPQADVVVTNPTHYAVALRYDKSKDNAPRVIAKGIDYLALRIKEIARENKVMVVENPPLARELYKLVEVDEQIPQKLFNAVVEVLVFVYKAKKESF